MENKNDVYVDLNVVIKELKVALSQQSTIDFMNCNPNTEKAVLHSEN